MTNPERELTAIVWPQVTSPSDSVGWQYLQTPYLDYHLCNCLEEKESAKRWECLNINLMNK